MEPAVTLRRLAHLLLLLVAAGLAWFGVRSAPPETGRGVIVGGIVALGALCNLLGLVFARLPARPWVRNLGGLVIFLFVGGAAAAALLIRTEHLPQVPRADQATRDWLLLLIDLLTWSAGAAAYAAVAVLLLPAAQRPPDVDTRGRKPG